MGRAIETPQPVGSGKLTDEMCETLALSLARRLAFHPDALDDWRSGGGQRERFNALAGKLKFEFVRAAASKHMGEARADSVVRSCSRNHASFRGRRDWNAYHLATYGESVEVI